MIVLEPTSYAGQKMGGMFKSGMSMGLAKVKSKVAIRGSQASLRITEARPTFYFYFEEKAGSFGSSNHNMYALATISMRGVWSRIRMVLGTKQKL